MQRQQGDVCLQVAADVPDGAKLVAKGVCRYTLAYGEASGHAHIAECDAPMDVYTLTRDDGLVLIYLRASAAVRVLHGRLLENGSVVAGAGTHGPQTMEPGIIRANQVSEADPFSEMVRAVTD